MASKIEQTIDDIYEYLDSCKYAAFSNKESIIVNKDDIYELLEELRNSTPDEIKKARNIAANQEAILEQARQRASDMLAKAEEKQGELIEKNEIMQQAYAQAVEVVNQANVSARDILNQASTEANNYQMSAMKYTDDSLAGISDILSKAISEAQSRYNDLISSLSSCLQVVTNDRAQLAMANEAEQIAIPGSDVPGQEQSARGGSIPPTVGASQGEDSRPQTIDRSNSIRENINDEDIDNL